MRTSVPEIDPRDIGHGPPFHGESLAREIVEAAVNRYFVARRGRIPAFVARNFGWRGALSLHRKALGSDLWRAPLNAALVAPALAIKGIAYGFGKAGRHETARWLMSREIFLKTGVAQEIEFRLHDELFELPYAQDARVVHKDALADLILADPRTKAALATLNGPWGEAERARLNASLREALAIYMQGRIAVSEIANLGLAMGAGFALLHQVTPGVLTLGPALADYVARTLALSAGAALTAAATGAALLASAAFVAASGILTDPIQAKLGIHQRRLLALVNSLEAAFLDCKGPAFAAREQYVARLAELFDVAAAVFRAAKG